MIDAVVLNDSVPLSPEISKVFPGFSYSQLKIKKRKIINSFRRSLPATTSDKFIHAKSKENLLELISQRTKDSPQSRVIILNSNLLFKDERKFSLFLEKLSTTDIDFLIGPGLNGFAGTWEKSKFFYDKLFDKPETTLDLEELEEDYLYPINDYWDLLNYSQSFYETRFFNKIKGFSYYLQKVSSDKVKIEKEFKYFQFIPDELKQFFVVPYNFKETTSESSYELERLKLVDLSMQWINDAINKDRFTVLLNKIFYFIGRRPKKFDVNSYDQLRHTENLYKTKVSNRINILKQCKSFTTIDTFIMNHTGYEGVDDILEEYINFIDFYHFKKGKYKNSHQCISHGDLCFSNILYEPTIDLMRLIDPKGAISKNEIYLDSYYDIAKLSHSILGDYDFINNSFFSFEFDHNMKVQLIIEDSQIREENKNLFRKALKERNIDINIIRLIEVSLFISMTPLHLDSIYKISAFLLKAIEILNEIKSKKTIFQQ